MKRTLLALLALTAPLVTFAEDAAVRRSYPVSKSGMLSLDVPSSWTEVLQVSKQGFPPTLSLTDPDGNTEVLVTPVWPPKGEAFNSTAKVRGFVQSAAARVLPTATQTELPLQPIRGRNGAGFYFWAKDRAPQPGEYEYMAEGAVPSGASLLSFIVLTHKEPPASLGSALVIIKSAELER